MNTEGPPILALSSYKFSKLTILFFLSLKYLQPYALFCHLMVFSSDMPSKIIHIFFVRTSQDVRETHFSSSPAMSPPHINLFPQGHGYVPANAHPHRAPRITEGSDRDSEIYVFGSSCLLCARYCQSALHIVTHLNFTILRFKGYFYPHFMDEQTEAPKH